MYAHPNPAPNSTDDELLRAWQAGDRDAGVALFERHWDSVARFFTSKIGRDSEDLIQETFAACVENAHRYRGDASFRAFLFGIARNKLLRFLRHKVRDSKVFDPDTTSVAGSLRSYTSIITHDRAREKLLHAMRELPVDTQLMLELHYWENMRVREIAEVVDMPVNTVKCRMRRGRQKLAEALAPVES